MKDMVPKGTGNSRFLRSSIAADITHEELVALLRSGKFPVDFAGLNSAGIQVQGSAYNKANVLPDTVCTRLNISTSSEPKDAFLSLSNKGGWKEIDRITTSKTWTVPSGVTQIGVLAIGGGESGLISRIYNTSSLLRAGLLPGGFAGHALSAILNVSPGQKFTVTIGSGGVSRSDAAGGVKVPGGNTSFSGNGVAIVAKGGGVYAHGVPGGSGLQVGYNAGDQLVIPYGTDIFSQSGFDSSVRHISIKSVGTGSTLSYVYSFCDPTYTFDSTKILSPGGTVYANFAKPESPVVQSYGAVDLGGLGKGGDSIAISGTSELAGNNATGYGNGGGSVLCYGNTAVTGKAGNGSPGIVIIYA